MATFIGFEISWSAGKTHILSELYSADIRYLPTGYPADGLLHIRIVASLWSGLSVGWLVGLS